MSFYVKPSSKRYKFFPLKIKFQKIFPVKLVHNDHPIGIGTKIVVEPSL